MTGCRQTYRWTDRRTDADVETRSNPKEPEHVRKAKTALSRAEKDFEGIRKESRA